MSETRDRSSLSGFLGRLFGWKLIVLVVLVILVLFSIILVQRARAVQSEYDAVVDQVAGIHDVVLQDDIYALSAEDMAWLNSEFRLLEERIDEIERLSELPAGAENRLSRLPWIEPRYAAGMETLQLGRMLATAGQTVSEIGQDAIAALDDTGIRYDPENDAVTWLDVLHTREDDLFTALDTIDEAAEQRQRIDEEYLRQGIVDRLMQIDEVMDQFDEQLELAEDFPLAYATMGAEEPIRYLVLFQNPAELRPTGGFVGTVARVELHRGQITEYEFLDVYEVAEDYADQDGHRVRAPWPIREYIRSDHLQFQDANWWPHFPESATLLMEMAEAAGWPELDGVVSVQPETVQDLIAVTGPITVDVDGDMREITSENLHDEAERQRRIMREGGDAETLHKEVIELISEILVDELADGDRYDLIESVFLLFDRLDIRDMQVYHRDEDVQAFVEDRDWAGLARPQQDTPTVSSIFANITGLKTSLAMQPAINLQILESDTAGMLEGILTVALEHRGQEDGDPFYEGFQRWWVDLDLPEGSSVVQTLPDPSSDPDASDGGAYIVNLPVGEREEIVIRLSMPDTDRLLFRRQPGLTTMYGSVEQAGCDEALEFTGEEDRVILLDGECPEIEWTDDGAEE